ncbi:MAG: nucleotide exchange factor GrpE [Saccharofermentans sp.]|nr:nucleotide exchange factor GrpE [Saccharofermentans sp.]
MAETSGEEIIFGQDDEPVKTDAAQEAAEDAAAADAKQAEGEAEAGPEETAEEEAKEDQEDPVARELEETKTRYMYLYAEYDNYRKRTAKEKDNLYSDAVAKVTGEFLGVIDNIDRAIASANGADKDSVDKIVQGIELVGKQSYEILAKIGVEEIPVERGTKFDPNFHEAVMHIEDGDLGENEVAQVFQKGYQYKDRVIRHAVVQVAN